MSVKHIFLRGIWRIETPEIMPALLSAAFRRGRKYAHFGIEAEKPLNFGVVLSEAPVLVYVEALFVTVRRGGCASVAAACLGYERY